MKKQYLIVLFGVLALAVASCGSKDKKKEMGKANPCGKTEKVANPCGKTEKVANPCGKTEKVANPCGKTEKVANPCGKTEKVANPCGMKDHAMKDGAKKDHAMKDGAEKTAMSTASPKKGKKIFRANGCTACHDSKTGMEIKPFPSLPHMASISEAEFKKCILEGRKGTAMAAFKGKVSEDDVKSIRAYVLKYKGK